MTRLRRLVPLLVLALAVVVPGPADAHGGAQRVRVYGPVLDGINLDYRKHTFRVPYGSVDSVGVSHDSLVTTVGGGDGVYGVRIYGLGGKLKLARGRVQGLALTDRTSPYAAWSEFKTDAYGRFHTLRIADTGSGKVIYSHVFEDDVYVEAVHDDHVVVSVNHGATYVITPGAATTTLPIPEDVLVLDYDGTHVAYGDLDSVTVADLDGTVVRRLAHAGTARLFGNHVAGLASYENEESSRGYVASLTDHSRSRLTRFTSVLSVSWTGGGKVLVRSSDPSAEQNVREQAALCTAAGACATLTGGGDFLLPNDSFGSLISELGD